MTCIILLFKYCLLGLGDEKVQEVADQMGTGASCSTLGEKLQEGGDWPNLLEITDESAFDGEVEKRLNHMVPIPVSAAFAGYIAIAFLMKRKEQK